MHTEFHGYGERGSVNALVFELVVRNAGTHLLRSIRWVSDRQPVWIEDVIAVDIVVEMSMAEFGSPDLILSVATVKHGTQVIFIDAKASTYMLSTMPNGLGMLPGFNSSINGQLALRYRCSHALSQFKEDDNDLVEPTWLHQTYALPVERSGLLDPSRFPRHLQNGIVLNLVRRHNLSALPLENYHFVALTNDDHPFWQTIPYGMDADYLPQFLGQNSQEYWQLLQSQVGWLGWSPLGRELVLGPRYIAAAKTMVARPGFTPTAINPPPPLQAIPRLENTAWADQPPSLLEERDAIEQSARNFFGANSVKRRKGSSSVYLSRPNGRRVVDLKIASYLLGAEYYFGIGIHDVRMTPRYWCPYELDGPFLAGLRHPQPFSMVRLRGNQAESLAIAEEIFEIIRNDLDVFLA